MTPRFQHDCSDCTFLGYGFYQRAPVDWYVCKVPQDGLRTVIARRSDELSDYASGVIGETVEPHPVVIAALAHGLELSQAEKDQLLKSLLHAHRSRMGFHFFHDCVDPQSEEHNQIGPANWLDLEPMEV
jgi:hypothetical protein